MGTFDTYSKRKKRIENAGQPDVYIYDKLPMRLRVQIIHIWNSAIGPFLSRERRLPFQPPPHSNKLWWRLHTTICRELSLLTLGDSSSDPFNRCQQFLLKEEEVDNVLDIIEVSFWVINTIVRKMIPSERSDSNIIQSPDDAIEELNYRFRENSVGYQYVKGKIIKANSQYIQAEVVRPTISLLSDVKFKGAEEEFLKAHEHYRKGRNKEAIAEANKAFESTMRSICSAKSWNVPANATASRLIQACFDNELIPSSLQSHFGAFQSTLKDGLPTVRNKLAGHGQGPTPIQVPDYLAAYALHLAATNIVFLVKAFLNLK